MNEFLQKLWDKQSARKDEKTSASNKFKTTTALDVVLMFDTTGSMYGFLRGSALRIESSGFEDP